MLKADATTNVLKRSSTLFNHTIKNEIGKVGILIHQMQLLLQRYDRRGAEVAELEEMLALAADSVQHIQMIMATVNDRVRTVKLNLAKQNILPIVVQCLATFEKTIGQQITIEQALESVSDVYFDAVHMKEVIYNILNNAAEVMEYNGKIRVSLKETNKEVVLQIEDTGMGIPKEDLSVIFEPFYSTKNRQENFGLGLYYCKNVMSQQNGSIHVESTPGQGTSFYLLLTK